MYVISTDKIPYYGSRNPENFQEFCIKLFTEKLNTRRNVVAYEAKVALRNDDKLNTVRALKLTFIAARKVSTDYSRKRMRA